MAFCVLTVWVRRFEFVGVWWLAYVERKRDAQTPEVHAYSLSTERATGYNLRIN